MPRPLLSPSLAALLLALAATHAVAATPTAEASVLRRVCDKAWHAPPASMDLDAVEEEASALQDRGDEKAIELACQGWAYAQHRFGPADLRTVRWTNSLGIGLFTRQRSIEAMTVLVDSYERALALGAPGRALALRAAGVVSLIHLQRQEMEDGLRWSGRSVALVDPSLAPTADELRLQINHASLLSMARREDEARRVYEQALARAQTRPDEFKLEILGILHQWAVAERRSGRSDAALALNTRSIEHLRTALPDQLASLALALHNRGVLLRELARFDEAERALRDALSLSRNQPAPDLFQAHANIRDTLSSMLVSRGKVPEALALAREAVAMVTSGPEAGTAGTLRPLRRLAEAQTAAGDLAGAAATWRRALPIIESRPDAGDLETRLAVWLSHARTQLLLGDMAEAERMADRAEADVAGKASPPLERAGRLELRAALRRTQGRPADALALLADADRALAEQLPPAHPQRVRVAALACQLGERCAPLATTPDAASMPPDVQALRALALAQDARRHGRLQDAEEGLRNALEQAHAAADLVLQWRSLAEYAQLQAQQGRWAEAVFFGKRALALVQRLRDSAGRASARGDEHYLRDKAEIYRQVADWLLQEQRMAEALEVLRLLKRSELDDFRERAGPPGTAGPSLTTQEQRLQRLLDAVTESGRDEAADIQRLRELARLQRITPGEQRRLDELLARQQAARQAARTQWDEALADVRRAAGRERGSGTVPQALGQVLPGELRAWLMVTRAASGSPELVAVLAGPRATWVERQPLDTSEPMAVRIAALMDRLQNRQGALEQAQALYASVGRLVDRAAQRVRATRVVLWLDGPLRYLPMGVLHDGRQYLGARLNFVLSGNDLSEPLPAPRAHAAPRLQAWGMTQARSGLPALPGVADELCQIVDGPVHGLAAPASACRPGDPPRGQGAWRGRADADARFTEAALVDPERRATHVHIGTHFVLRPGNITRSWLLLGDGTPLSLQRLAELPLGQPALVTLSACETAVPGQGDDGREIDGLAASWLAKGAQQVLATLWRVDDRATARLMQSFYRALAQPGMDAARALQHAQRAEMRAAGPKAVPHWAAFTLMERR